MSDDEALDGAVKVPEKFQPYDDDPVDIVDITPRIPAAGVTFDLMAIAGEAVALIERLEQMVLERDALLLERDTEIDRLLVEAVVLREKQERHDKVLAEKENQIAWDKHEIRRLTDMTRKWWQK